MIFNTVFGAWDFNDINAVNWNSIDLQKDQTNFSIIRKDIIIKNWWLPIAPDSTIITDNNIKINDSLAEKENNEKIIWEVTDWNDSYSPPISFPKLWVNLIQEKVEEWMSDIIKSVIREFVSSFRSIFIKYKPVAVNKFYTFTIPWQWAWAWWGGWSNVILTDAIVDYNAQMSNNVLQRASNISTTNLDKTNQTVNVLESTKNLICNYWYKLENWKCIKIDFNSEFSNSDTTINSSSNNSTDMPDSIPWIPRIENVWSNKDIYSSCDIYPVKSFLWEFCRSNINLWNTNFSY